MLDRRRFLVSSALAIGGGLTAIKAQAGEWTGTSSRPLVGSPGGPEKLHSVIETLDLSYQEDDNPRHQLDIFSPRGLRGTPVLFFVHGGTWMVGDKNFFGLYRGVGRFLAQHGVTAVLINYRLSPIVKHPEHARDVARALAWTIKNISRYGGDPNRLVVCGHSAGGHLATLVATDPSYLADPALKLDQAKKAIKGVIGVSGVYRVPGPDEFQGMLTHIVQSLARSPWMAPVLMKVGEVANPFSLVFGSDRDVQEKASPITHIHKGLPPFLVLYANAEVPGLAQQAADFSRELEKAGTKVELREIPGVTHRSILFNLNNPADPAGKALLDFIQKTTGSPAEKIATSARM